MTAALTVRLEPDQLEALADLVVERLGSLRRAAAPAPAWLTTKEAAKRLCMHPSEVQRAAAAGAIPHEQDRPGCALRFEADKLDEWVRHGRPGMPRRSRAGGSSASKSLPEGPPHRPKP